MKDMRGKSKKTALPERGILLVLLVSVMYVVLLAGGNPEAFLIDDNRTQWYPVMERAYEDFWTTGRIYCYDFYQMKGMPIAEQGYYGVMNPFILLSYTVTKLLPVGIDAVTCYIGLMVVLGNLFFYLTCRRLGCRESMALLMTLTYGTMGCFWAFFYWYYVFNNYFMVPLLVYVFLRCTQEGRLSYCACGIVLSMDLWMGNVQYTFYHYLLFGILCLTMILLNNIRYFKILCANAAVGVMLSLPMILLLLQASGGFQKQEDFMEYPLLYFSLLLHSAIPQGILRRHGEGVSFLNSVVMSREDNLVCYMGAVGILLFAALVRVVGQILKRAGKQVGGSGEQTSAGIWEQLRRIEGDVREGYGRALAWTHEKKTVAGCTAAFFFLLSLMSGGTAARLLGAMPVVSNFRYLFKAIFPAAPLAVLLLAYLICGAAGEDRTGRSVGSEAGGKSGAGSRKARRFRFTAGFLAACTCLGVVNACDTVKLVRAMYDMRIEGAFAKEKENALSALASAKVDGKNYRMATFLQFSRLNDECFDQSRNLTRNFPTAAGVYTLAGYEIATKESRLKMFDAVYSDADFYTCYANADTLENFSRNLLSQPETVQRQLIDNSVRYLLLDRTRPEDNVMVQGWKQPYFWKDRREDVITALRELSDLRVERVCAFNDHYDLVELSGTDSLCMDGAGHMVPLTDENMQTLSFEAKEAGDYRLSFAWDSRLEAFVTEADGTVRPLAVERTENGNIRISTAGSTGQVTLTWHDPLCTAGFVWESVTVFTFFGLFAALAFLGKKCYSRNTNRKYVEAD